MPEGSKIQGRTQSCNHSETKDSHYPEDVRVLYKTIIRHPVHIQGNDCQQFGNSLLDGLTETL